MSTGISMQRYFVAFNAKVIRAFMKEHKIDCSCSVWIS